MVIWQAGLALSSTVGPAPLSLGKLVIRLSESWSVGTGNPIPPPSRLLSLSFLSFVVNCSHSLLSIITIPHNRAELVTSAVRSVVYYCSNRNCIKCLFVCFHLFLEFCGMFLTLYKIGLECTLISSCKNCKISQNIYNKCMLYCSKV